MKINKYEINGSNVAACQIKQLRIVSVVLYIKAGAWFENRKTEGGYFHFLEHLMMTGTKKFKSRQEIAIYKEKFGISCGASTGNKNMSFWFDFPDVHLKEGFNLIEEIIFKSTINFDNVNNELSIIEQEYNDSWNSPYKKFSAKIGEHLGGEDCNLNNQILGTPQTLKLAKRKDLQKLYRRYFVPTNIFWGVSGNFVVKELELILNKIIPIIEAKMTETDVKVINYQPEYGKIEFKSKTEQPEVRLIWQLPSIKKLGLIKKFSLNKFNYIFGSGNNSALFMRIRQEMGLTYGIYSHFWNWPNVSFLEISFATSMAKIETVIKETDLILKKLIDEPIDESRIKRVGNYMDLKTIMSFSSPHEVADALAWDLYENNQVMTPEQINNLAHKANFEETQKWLKDNLDEEKMLTAVMIPEDYRKVAERIITPKRINNRYSRIMERCKSPF